MDPDPAFGLQQRPWKVEGFSTELRKMWETMYFTLESAPMGNWENTEDYQREKVCLLSFPRHVDACFC